MVLTDERVVEGETHKRLWDDHVARYELAAKYVNKRKVLDIACGTGYGSKLLKEAGAARVWGIDISLEAVEYAREKYNKEGVQFLVGDITSIPLPAASVDVVACFETIEHVEDYERVIDELHRVLKPDGMLTISTPSRTLSSPGRAMGDRPWNKNHKVEFTAEELQCLLEPHFEKLTVYGQRFVSKIFFLPGVEILRKKGLFYNFYTPDRGTPALQEIPSKYKPWYITIQCEHKRRPQFVSDIGIA
jgi:ubiquinone/menaquinone biosynthesis C-methylase UbiE